MSQTVRTDEERWNFLEKSSSLELLGYLEDLGDFAHEFGFETGALDMLEYIVIRHHPELEGCLEAFEEAHGSGDYSSMHPNETDEEFFAHENLEFEFA